ncbi:MAG: hypothetical protein QM503_03780 [Bacteroidota bacterium]
MNAYDKASMIFLPHFRKDGKAHALKPTNGNGDLTVGRNCPALEIDNYGKLKLVAANVPRFNHAVLGGCPKLLQEPEGVNLFTRPVSVGHNDWIKNNSKIECDAATASAEKVSNGNFATSDVSQWNNIKGGVLTAPAGEGVFTCDGTTGELRMGINALVTGMGALLSFKLKSGTLSTSPSVYIGGAYYDFSTAIGAAYTEYTLNIANLGTDEIYFIVFNHNQADISNGTVINIDDASFKDLNGFESPCVDYPNHAFKITEDSSNDVHEMHISNTITASTIHVVSLRIQKDERNWVALKVYDGTASHTVWFDINNGVIGTEINATGVINELYGGWSDCYLIFTTSVGTSISTYIHLADADNSINYQGVNGSGARVFLADLKESAITMLPIYDGVEGASTTRLLDYLTLADLQSKGLLTTEWSMLLEIDSAIINGSHDESYLSFNDAANQLLFNLELGRNGYFRPYYPADSAYPFGPAIGDVDKIKIAISYKDGKWNAAISGVIQVEYIETNSLGLIDKILLNAISHRKELVKLIPYPIALSNAELINLST